MNKKLYSLLFSAALCATAYGQRADDVPAKMDARLQLLLRQQQAQAAAPSVTKEAALQDTLLHVIIKAENSHTLADSLRRAGHRATVITPTILTAELPLMALPTTAKHPLCRFINSSRQHKAFLDKARPATKTDKTHKGEGLETPYQGKGVIVAVIDQSFQGKHIAFADSAGNSRVIASWNRNKPTAKPVMGPLETDWDGIEGSGGHGTHVLSIAAGSDKGNGLAGIAPQADIIMIPSSFRDAEVLEDLVFIDSVATAQGKPVVVNMSFGSIMGPHDGTKDYDIAASTFMTEKKGRVITAAMGNDAEETHHAYHAFTTDNETVHLLIKPNDESTILIDLWGQKTDSATHLKVVPYLQSPTTSTNYSVKRSTSASRYWYAEVDENNKKENYFFGGSVDGHTTRVTNPYLLLKITGNTGDEFHAWVEQGYGEIIAKHPTLTNLVKADNDYCVGEGAASIPYAVAVGAYNTAVSWTALNGAQYNYTDADPKNVGRIANFSSHGPWLGEQAKPTIAAPGAAITAAYNRFDPDFDSTSPMVVKKTKAHGVTDYYGIMQGTSMAAPAAAGAIALWLEANPNLTISDVLDILKKTAIKDGNTGQEEWSKLYGYGKIDVYEGLKEALKRITNIQAVHQSPTPVTLSKTATAWQLLFGSNERDVRVEVLSLSGQRMETRSLGSVQAGEEVTLNFSAYPAGVYLVRITTPRATLVRKVLK